MSLIIQVSSGIENARGRKRAAIRNGIAMVLINLNGSSVVLHGREAIGLWRRLGHRGKKKQRPLDSVLAWGSLSSCGPSTIQPFRKKRA
jgi:hypothetical protein